MICHLYVVDDIDMIEAIYHGISLPHKQLEMLGECSALRLLIPWR